MTRKLIYTQDSVGEYTIADETEKWVTVVGRVETESDARLFCTAPELLEALQLAEKAMVKGRNVTYPERYGVINKARAAISKATGETK